MPKPTLNVVPKPTSKVDSFLDLAAKKGRTGVVCWRQTLSSDIREAIEAMEQRMNDGEVFPWEAISNALTEQFGFVIKANGIARHYRGKCQCPRDGSDV